MHRSEDCFLIFLCFIWKICPLPIVADLICDYLQLFGGNDADEFSSILKQESIPKILITTCRFNSTVCSVTAAMEPLMWTRKSCSIFTFSLQRGFFFVLFGSYGYLVCREDQLLYQNYLQ